MSEAQQELPVVEVRTTSELFALVYDRLKLLASKQLRREAVSSLCTTELVHEVFTRIAGATGPRFDTQLEFFSYSARAMRHLLVDIARQRTTTKAGGGLRRVDLADSDAEHIVVDPLPAIELDNAISTLQQDAPRAAQVLELHYFAGLSLEAVSKLTAVSTRTIDREWRYAKAFLAALMRTE
jgi:RNA polymerase sigma factor (TIGR02999 family)